MNENTGTLVTEHTSRQSKGISKAMILAAGLGTRLKPWTDNNPKALAIVNGKTLLQRNIEYLQQYGINEVVVNVHHFADMVKEAIDANNGWGSKVTVSDESDAVLETGGGILNAATYLDGDEPFVVLNVDILTDLNLASMMNYHLEKKPLATLATSTRATSRYLLFDEGNNLCGWYNTKTGEELAGSEANLGLHNKPGVQAKAFSGVHIIEPSIFKLTNRSGKFSIIDLYMDLMGSNTIKSFDDSDSRFIDVGKPENVEKAEAMFR
ncbi:nucleotidyltransferase family protein [Aridibaculum aurantiacum]|uniref:nucleotidyltransferase family protein n=1 Tax=Aridibaculum aurantiacum TaxID=2810307 RepID=UPI001A9784A4|nr:nucleotidyltransferase family protein [Aridibaculum aurantiacum]